jgi:hypothetical protein
VQKWEDNIKMDIKWIVLGHEPDWTVSGYGQWWALVNTVMNPSGFIKGRTFHDKLNDHQLLKKTLLHEDDWVLKLYVHSE